MTVEPVGLVIALSASSLVWVLATRWLAVIVLSLLEPKEGGPDPKPLLAVGRLPGRSEMAHAAYVIGGEARVAELVLTQAVADGWLLERPGRRGHFEVFEPRQDASPDAASLKRHLGHAPDLVKVRAAAKAVAAERSPAIRQDLERAGLRRPPGHLTIAIAAGLFSAATFTFAFAEFWEMAAKDALAERFVLGGALLFSLAMGAVLATLPRKTSRAEEYEAWLIDATVGAQDAARDGSISEPRDVSLALVTAGLGALSGARFAALRSNPEG